jgi:TP901 family phage tail tape measure protein
MDLFKLFGRIVVDGAEAITNIDNVVKKAASGGEELSAKLSNIGGSMISAGGKLTSTVTTGLLAVGGLAAKSAIGFEDAIANINTLLDDDSHLAGYENAIKELSNTTGIALDTVSQGMYQTISSIGDGGESTERMFNIMGRSAKAGSAEVSDSVALISAGMKGYNQVNEEAAQKISDLAFQTAKLGVTTFPELAKSMQPLFPLANSLGLSYEDLFGSMATLTGVTGNTAEVTTQLKAIFSNLMAPTADMQKLIEKYGYSSGQAMIETEGFAGTLRIVQQETGGQTDKMATLFSSIEAVTAMTALTGSQFDTFNMKLGEMQNATGATEAAYAKLDTTGSKLRTTWTQVKNTVTELGGTLLETFAPAIESGAAKVRDLCNWFNNLDEGTKSIILKTAGLAAALGPVLIIGGSMAKGLSSIITLFGSLHGVGSTVLGLISKAPAVISGVISVGSTLMGGISTIGSFITTTLIPAIVSIGAPVLIVIGVIAALIAIGVLLYKNWDDISAWCAKAWESIKDTVSKGVEAVTGFFEKIISFVSENWQGLLLLLVNPFLGAFKLLYDNCEQFRNFVDNFVNNIKEFLSNVGKIIVTGVKNFCNSVHEKWTDLKSKAAQNWKEMKSNASDKWSEIKDTVSEKANELKENTTNTIKQLLLSYVAVNDKMHQCTEDTWEKIKQAGSSKASEMKASITDAFQSIGAKAADVWDGIGNKTTAVFTHVKDFISNVVDHIKKIFEFEWKMPDVKLPHFNVDPSGWQIGDLLQGSIPHLDVEWYAKGGVMEEPTAFGVNPKSGATMVGGEAGKEAIAPITVLQEYIKDAVEESNSGTYKLVAELLSIIKNYLPNLAELQVVLDTGETVGALASPMNTALGKIAHKNERTR